MHNFLKLLIFFIFSIGFELIVHITKSNFLQKKITLKWGHNGPKIPKIKVANIIYIKQWSKIKIQSVLGLFLSLKLCVSSYG